MRVFISADIEGITGVTRWEETQYGGQGYAEACMQMTKETAAACKAAQDLGYDVVVKDGHEDAVNIDINGMPRGVELIRGWRCSPAAMMGGLDDSFQAAIYIGYHAPEGSDGSPLAHTVEHGWFNWIRINDCLASEFTINALWAAAYKVPSVFISGDKCICEQAKNICDGIITVATKEGTGNSTWNMHPMDVLDSIYAGVQEALNEGHSLINLENEYKMDICFKEHQRARAASWYPGTTLINPTTVSYTAKDPIELITAKMFMTEI